MADTLPDITVTPTPQSVAALTGGSIATGVAMRIQCLGPVPVYYAIAASAPDKSGKRRLETRGAASIVDIAAGENDVWVWSVGKNTSANAELA